MRSGGLGRGIPRERGEAARRPPKRPERASKRKDAGQTGRRPGAERQAEQLEQLQDGPAEPGRGARRRQMMQIGLLEQIK